MKKYKMMINGEKYEAKVLSYKGNEARVNVNGIDYIIEIEHEAGYMSQPVIQTSKSYINPEKISSSVKRSGSDQLTAPIPGTVISVHKKEGDSVEAGEVLITLEAMKMESELVAPVSGKIKEIKVSNGDSVLEGDLLIIIAGSEVKERVKKSFSQNQQQEQRPTQATPRTVVDGNVRAPIPGTVLDIRVKEGDKVSPDDVVIILEAMKMESEIHAENGGTVKKILVSKGDSVNEGDVLVKIGD